MKLITILRFEFKRRTSLGVALQSDTELKSSDTCDTQGHTARMGVGEQSKGNALGESQKPSPIWIQCFIFYLWSLGHYCSLFPLKQVEKATALEVGNSETRTWFAAGGPSQYRHGLFPRLLAGCLETRGFSRYSITHPAGVLPGYRPLCVASPWLL